MAMKNINQIVLSLSVIMEWVLHPIVMAMVMEKMGIMALVGGVPSVDGNRKQKRVILFAVAIAM